MSGDEDLEGQTECILVISAIMFAGVMWLLTDWANALSISILFIALSFTNYVPWQDEDDSPEWFVMYFIVYVLILRSLLILAALAVNYGFSEYQW